MKELLEHLLKSGNYENGICHGIWMTEYPYCTKLKTYTFLHKNKPKWHNKFYWDKSYKGVGFWWKCNVEGNQQRKLFLQHLINKL